MNLLVMFFNEFVEDTLCTPLVMLKIYSFSNQNNFLENLFLVDQRY